MAKNVFVGVSNTARKVKRIYIGVDGVARKVKRVYLGVNGIARLVYSSELSYELFVSSDGLNSNVASEGVGKYAILVSIRNGAYARDTSAQNQSNIAIPNSSDISSSINGKCGPYRMSLQDSDGQYYFSYMTDNLAINRVNYVYNPDWRFRCVNTAGRNGYMMFPGSDLRYKDNHFVFSNLTYQDRPISDNVANRIGDNPGTAYATQNSKYAIVYGSDTGTADAYDDNLTLVNFSITNTDIYGFTDGPFNYTETYGIGYVKMASASNSKIFCIDKNLVTTTLPLSDFLRNGTLISAKGSCLSDYYMGRYTKYVAILNAQTLTVENMPLPQSNATNKYNVGAARSNNSIIFPGTSDETLLYRFKINT